MFRPFACDLHAMNATHFAQCLKGQRIIIIGDSTMRQVFQSLACLLHEEVVDGYLVVRPTPTSENAQTCLSSSLKDCYSVRLTCLSWLLSEGMAVLIRHFLLSNYV